MSDDDVGGDRVLHDSPRLLFSDRDQRFLDRCADVRAQHPSVSDEQAVLHQQPWFPGIAAMKLAADEKKRAVDKLEEFRRLLNDHDSIDYTDVPT